MSSRIVWTAFLHAEEAPRIPAFNVADEVKQPFGIGGSATHVAVQGPVHPGLSLTENREYERVAQGSQANGRASAG